MTSRNPAQKVQDEIEARRRKVQTERAEKSADPKFQKSAGKKAAAS